MVSLSIIFFLRLRLLLRLQDAGRLGVEHLKRVQLGVNLVPHRNHLPGKLDLLDSDRLELPEEDAPGRVVVERCTLLPLFLLVEEIVKLLRDSLELQPHASLLLFENVELSIGNIPRRGLG